MKLLNRNIILLILTIAFVVTNTLLTKWFYNNKISQIKELEIEQRDANEQFITAQILSEKLNQTYKLFETNLIVDKNDSKNKEANTEFPE